METKIMNLTKFTLILLAILYLNPIIAQTKLNKKSYRATNIEKVNKTFNKYDDRVLLTEPGKISEDYQIGSEIPVDGASGFYDYQSNGECRKYINRFSGNIMMAVYLTATDSNNILGSRKTIYSGSSNDGANWNFLSQIPAYGPPSIISTVSGNAVICPTSNGLIAKETFPLSGQFNFFNSNIGIIHPGCIKLSDNKIMVTGYTYYNGASTDTGIVTIYDPGTNNFTVPYKFTAGNSVSMTNMRMTYAAGPAGKALILLSTISDIGGNNGYNRMFIIFTSDYGNSWSSPSVFYNPSILSGEFAIPFLGIDAIYDNSGNYYIAFNTTDTLGQFSSAKLWVSKNGDSPVIVAQNSGQNGVPNAGTVLHADAGICTIDHPSLSVSADGNWIFCAFSVQFQNDTLNGFNKCHIYYTGSAAGTLNFLTPVQVTNSGPDSYDERYASLNPVSPDLGGNSGITLYLSYQKDTQPGSCAFNDAAPVSRSNQIFRKIYTSNIPIGITNTGNEIPKIYELYQNYPNPFNPSTKIRFSVPVSSNVTLEIFDAAGRLVKTLVRNRTVTAGLNEVVFNAVNLPSGIYFYKLSSEYHSITRKMVLIK